MADTVVRNARRYTRSDIDMWALLAERLKQARMQADYSQYRLAKETRTSQGIISAIEAGKRPQLSLWVARRFAEKLGVSLDYLVGLRAEP